MRSSDPQFDWHALAAEPTQPVASGTRHRLRLVALVVLAASGLVLLRTAQLELTGGAEFRTLATRPITHVETLAADRGRILARDGTVLAARARTPALALHYRWLQRPADPTWLRRQATSGLDRRGRRDRALVEKRERELLARRDDLHRRLAELCGMSDAEWQERCRAVDERVARLAQKVNERRRARYLSELEQAAELPDEPGTWTESLAVALADLFAPDVPAPPARIVLAEEQDFHPLVEDVSAEVVAEIAAHADDYPGVRIVDLVRRQYPVGRLAAHVIGHLGPADDSHAGILVGRLGIERQYEALLCGTPGALVERVDRRGRSLGITEHRAPLAGHDLRLTLDWALEQMAEGLLDAACRPGLAGAESRAVGGAIVVMDVESGELLVAASAPGFEPQWFAAGDGPALAALFAAPDRPLVNRASQMAIAPGSVFKTLTAVALLEMGITTPEEEIFCQGYLHEPDRQRCLIYRRQGIGHGHVDLAGALAQSCNVYFFQHASALGPEPLIAWARRFGFGQATGVDLPDEAAGSVPHSTPDEGRGKRLATAQALAIGQGTFTATPLQVARLMAAVANGGRLVQPRLLLATAGAAPGAGSGSAAPARQPLRVSADTLAAVREGLRRTVDSPDGTAYASARLASVPVAGKTGTAQTSGADHAWFAAYAPADAPRYAVVVALEHGSSAAMAARAARDLFARMHRLGYFSTAAPDLAGP